MNRQRILIVEDDKETRELTAEFLQAKNYLVVTATNGVECIKKFKESKFDMIILDVRMPNLDGHTTCKMIRNTSNIPIIFLTALADESDQIRGFDLGCDDYITKPFNPLELVARVKSQLRRYTQLGNMNESVKGDAVFSCGGLIINDDTKEVSVDGEAVKLTPIEYNILLLLVKNAGKVFSIDEIYTSIWNEEAIGADNTVAVHIRHIREKIEIDSRKPKYLKVVWGVGYKIEKQGKPEE